MTGNQIDLLVIGEGLSGITAAAAAAGQGLRVMLVSTGPGTFVLGTAGVDLDGLATRDLGFGKYDADEIEEAIAFFAELSASAGFVFQGGLRDRRLVPTIMGTFQTVSMAPHSLWKGDPRGLAKVVVAGIEAMSGFDAAFVADRLYLHSRQMNLNTSYRSAVVKAARGSPPCVDGRGSRGSCGSRSGLSRCFGCCPEECGARRGTADHPWHSRNEIGGRRHQAVRRRYRLSGLRTVDHASFRAGFASAATV